MRLMIMFATLCLTACCNNAVQKKTETTKTQINFTEEIKLVKPDVVAGFTVNEALQLRRSWREYGNEPLTLEEVSGVIWAAAGINRPDGHKTAPSALGLYPIKVYAFFADGVYLYDEKEHKLVRVLEGDYRAESGAQPFVSTAQMNLVYIADKSVYDGKQMPQDAIRYSCGLDAAGAAENVNIYTAGHGLRAITRGSFSPTILKTLNLDENRYFCALAQSVGK